MKPMDLNSTPLISYHDIKVHEIDILEDAWGINSEFYKVIELLRQLNPEPDSRLTTSLIEKIRKKY